MDHSSLLSEIAQLKTASSKLLKQRYAELFGEAPRCRTRERLFHRIAWRLQVLATGDLSERARQRAAEIACDADLRILAPSDFVADVSPVRASGSRNVRRSSADRRIPPAGTILSRQYKDRTVTVTVLRDGFEWEGRQYDSLSAIATQATRTRWNGFAFFGLKRPRGPWNDGR
jgi:hypothetical protein